MNYNFWNEEFANQAKKEGWGIYLDNNSNLFETIQKDDDSNIFDDDEAAISFVKDRARNGSIMHKNALLYILRDDNIKE
jgi:hypothetical protein